MKKLTRFLPVLLIVTGCAHSEKQKVSKSQPAKVSKEIIDKYQSKMSVESLRLGFGRTIQCSTPKSKWEKAKWQQIVSIANNCLKSRNFRKVSQLANHLSINEHLSPWGPYYLSIVALYYKQYDRALWMLDLASKKSPDLGLINFQRGRLYWEQGQHELAIFEMNKALENDPQITEANYFLAKIYLRDQHLDKSEHHFELVHKKEPLNIDALVGLAEIRIAQKDADGATSLLNKAIRLQPKDYSLYLRKAYVHEHMQQNLPQALAVYKEVRLLGVSSNYDTYLGMPIKEKIKTLEQTLQQTKSTETMSKL